MLYRKLGNTGYDISTIGFGTWQLGGERWQAKSFEESIYLLQSALDLGVNIYDVAVVYGQYKDTLDTLQSRSQELLGEAFNNRRNQVIYCLKLGQFDEISHRSDYTPQRLINQFQQSLRRLKTDYIDICLIHAPSIQEVEAGRAITVLQTLQAQGYVNAIGYSFEAEPNHVKVAVEQPIDCIMLQYNLLETHCRDVMRLAEKYGIGLLVGGPYKRGYLTGKYLSIDQLPLADDYWRRNIALNKYKVEGIISQVNELLKEYRTSKALRNAALNFILKESCVASCIIGHRNIEEVTENIEIIGKITDVKNPSNLFDKKKVVNVASIS